MTAVLTKWIFYELYFVFLLFIHSFNRQRSVETKKNEQSLNIKNKKENEKEGKMKHTHAAYLNGLNWKPLLELLSNAVRLLAYWQIIAWKWCFSFHYNCNQFMPWFVLSMNAFFFYMKLTIYSSTKILVGLFNEKFDERFIRIFRTAIYYYNWLCIR